MENKLKNILIVVFTLIFLIVLFIKISPLLSNFDKNNIEEVYNGKSKKEVESVIDDFIVVNNVNKESKVSEIKDEIKRLNVIIEILNDNNYKLNNVQTEKITDIKNKKEELSYYNTAEKQIFYYTNYYKEEAVKHAFGSSFEGVFFINLEDNTLPFTSKLIFETKEQDNKYVDYDVSNLDKDIKEAFDEVGESHMLDGNDLDDIKFYYVYGNTKINGMFKTVNELDMYFRAYTDLDTNSIYLNGLYHVEGDASMKETIKNSLLYLVKNNILHVEIKEFNYLLGVQIKNEER